MRWSVSEKGFYADIEWRKWFAWYPVKMSDEWVWLETVLARKAHAHSRYGPYPLDGWEFKEAIDERVVK